MVIDTTVGGANANAYLSESEANDYWSARPHSSIWDDADDSHISLIIAATRMIDRILSPRKELRIQDSKYGASERKYYLIHPTWTGAPATTTQALAWPRTGMFDRNGNAIPSNVIPRDLKYAVAELAGQMASADRLTDNDTVAQGISSVKAGSVALTFRDNLQITRVLPDVVIDLLVPSWRTDEILQMIPSTIFEVFT